jgi:hypothetical protein
MIIGSTSEIDQRHHPAAVERLTGQVNRHRVYFSRGEQSESKTDSRR